MLWFTLELAKTISLPANILERLDAVFLAVWVTAVFTTFLSSYYLTIHYMNQYFNLRNHKIFSGIILPFIVNGTDSQLA
ncbi:GerAB/ArcD/ProY family transporter [Cohnella sp.]|uniref:GerAB/ArcD/ProY family transporter n=1 Tax=Cohnella sp. TaxID=1883426 RepID=UPI0035654834